MKVSCFVLVENNDDGPTETGTNHATESVALSNEGIDDKGYEKKSSGSNNSSLNKFFLHI